MKTMSSGSPVIDRLTGIGGLPCGHVVEIFGPSQSAKSSLALSLVRKHQDLLPTIVDAEYKFDAAYAKKMGLDLDRTVLLQSGDIGTILEFVKCVKPSIVILDSVASISTLSMSDLGVFLSKISAGIPNCGIVIWINQIRSTLSGRTVEYGQKPAQFFPAIRIMLTNPHTINDDYPRQRVTCKILNNRFAEPGEVDVEFYHGRGIWEDLEILSLATNDGIMYTTGNWFYYKDRCLGLGRYAAAKEFGKLPIRDAIEQKVRSL